MRFHGYELQNTPLAIMFACKAITSLEFSYVHPNHSEVWIYGRDWGKDIDVSVLGNFNVLVTHRMIINDKLWPDQTEFDYGHKFLTDNMDRFDLIITGDNHQNIMWESRHPERGSCQLINPGSIMRMSITQKDFQPTCVVYDTDLRKATVIPIPIEPIETVMDLKTVEDNVERMNAQQQIKDVIKETIESVYDVGADIPDFLAALKRINVQSPNDIIYDILEELGVQT
jgi:hypothetical protein